MRKILIRLCILSWMSTPAFAQQLRLGDQEFVLKNVTGSIVEFQGEKVLKIERDLEAIPFDEDRLEATVDEPTFARLVHSDFRDGIIEVQVYSQLQDPMPQDYQHAQGFIGIAFRVSEREKAYESIYLRPKVGRSDKQAYRNHTVQYYAYPDHKFATLRNAYPGKYETSAPVNIGEWITMRIEVNGQKAELFINNARYSTFVVDSMLSSSPRGGIGLYVDMGTIGYFKDLKVTSFTDRVETLVNDWKRAKSYTKSYLDAMPESAYNFQPTPEVRTFSEQMLHLTAANYNFAAAATGVKSPIDGLEAESNTRRSKAEISQQVMAGYDFVIDQIRQIPPRQLAEPIQLFGQFSMSRATALRKAFEHQTHHRGQTTIYLRLAGVPPPCGATVLSMHARSCKSKQGTDTTIGALQLFN